MRHLKKTAETYLPRDTPNGASHGDAKEEYDNGGENGDDEEECDKKPAKKKKDVAVTKRRGATALSSPG
jgi:hypothetical protein